MTSPLAYPGSQEDLAAAKARHPAGRLLTSRERLSFPDAVALLTGSWRVNDPVGFAATMASAATIAGHQVVDLSVSVGMHLVDALAGIGRRPDLAQWWVSGSAAGQLVVEARAEAPAGPDGAEVFVLAHLVEPMHPGSVPVDHSWVVVVVGDGSGGVAAVTRAMLACPRRPRCCPPPVSDVRFSLAALKARLLSPALEAEDASTREPAAVLSLPRRGDTTARTMRGDVLVR
ncbi:MAG: hypothetical protein ACRDZ3_07195 [Acidimicrobiia bacterium]